jgi:putative Mn2+ efflux pump MntP
MVRVVSFAAIVLLALGLSMDVTAVAAARGALGNVRPRDAAWLVLVFGGAHAVMPALGALAGENLGSFVDRWDHWVAFAVLVAVGGRMLWQARSGVSIPPVGVAATAGLAFVTAVDALAVGVTLPMLDAPVVLAIATIGTVAGLATGVGVVVGRWFGAQVGPRADAIGGLVLVALGTKILITHLA